MSKEEIYDLSDLSGYERLYQTLLKDSGIEPRRLRWMMYDWYCVNMVAYNEGTSEKLKPIDSVDFGWRMEKSRAQEYKTEVQLNKALNLLVWNVADKEPFIESNQQLYELHEQYSGAFRMQHGYGVTDRITSYSLCEDTLNPVHEPTTEFNPVAMQRLEDSHPQFVYICAPLRGDVPANIEFARRRPRRCSLEATSPSAHTSCSRPSPTPATPRRMPRPPRCV